VTVLLARVTSERVEDVHPGDGRAWRAAVAFAGVEACGAMVPLVEVADCEHAQAIRPAASRASPVRDPERFALFAAFAAGTDVATVMVYQSRRRRSSSRSGASGSDPEPPGNASAPSMVWLIGL